jgi:choline dehydrogenase
MTTQTSESTDYIVVGGGAAGSVVAGELSKTGADVLLVESGGIDSAATVSKFNMALGRVLSNIGAAVDRS